jgi:hypothetical protein
MIRYLLALLFSLFQPAAQDVRARGAVIVGSA